MRGQCAWPSAILATGCLTAGILVVTLRLRKGIYDVPSRKQA